MPRLTKTLIVGLGLVSAPAMADTIFEQDFQSGLGAGERIFTREYDSFENPNWHSTNNWMVHDGTSNPWVSGGNSFPNPNMTGNVLGHEHPNYDNREQSYYEIDLNLSSYENSELAFDFDSWIIDDDTDGFNVIAYQSTGGGRADPENTAGFMLLNPTGTSDMQYLSLPGNNTANPLDGGQLDEISGFSTGFNGHDATMNMAGTAMFNLSAFDGQMITLRFSFGSDLSSEPYNNSQNAEGINIDNILVTGDIPEPPDPGVPEPTGLALIGLGLLGFLRKRQLVKH